MELSLLGVSVSLDDSIFLAEGRGEDGGTPLRFAEEPNSLVSLPTDDKDIDLCNKKRK